MRKTTEEIRRIFKDKELRRPENREKRNARLRAIVGESFDFEEISKRSLGRYWKDRTPVERKEFIALYSELLENLYLKRIKKHESELQKHEDDKYFILDERVEDSFASVKTKVVTYRGTEIPVDYKLLKRDGKWKAYDIVIEGVSLVNNYRTQFNQIIRSSSYEELIKKMRSKQLGSLGEKK
ncbi:MAG TPA: ABC transporter substrate-binding protein [Dissulfurispiraceae bacterium]